MTNKESIKHLRDLIKGRKELLEKVRRTKWRPSEKAMASGNYQRQIDALEHVIEIMEEGARKLDEKLAGDTAAKADEEDDAFSDYHAWRSHL